MGGREVQGRWWQYLEIPGYQTRYERECRAFDARWDEEGLCRMVVSEEGVTITIKWDGVIVETDSD